MLDLSTGIIEGLLVYPEAIAANLARSGGLVYSQRVLLALVDRGLTREQAYALVQRHAMSAWGGLGSFRELLQADPEVTAHLRPADFDGLFDPSYAVRHVDAIYRRVLEPEPVTASERA
jgi:adenylosuccinate lyase